MPASYIRISALGNRISATARHSCGSQEHASRSSARSIKEGPRGVATALMVGLGQTTDAGASLRIARLFETGDSRYVWLTRLQAIGVGERVGTTGQVRLLRAEGEGVPTGISVCTERS